MTEGIATSEGGTRIERGNGVKGGKERPKTSPRHIICVRKCSLARDSKSGVRDIVRYAVVEKMRPRASLCPASASFRIYSSSLTPCVALLMMLDALLAALPAVSPAFA